MSKIRLNEIHTAAIELDNWITSKKAKELTDDSILLPGKKNILIERIRLAFYAGYGNGEKKLMKPRK